MVPQDWHLVFEQVSLALIPLDGNLELLLLCKDTIKAIDYVSNHGREVLVDHSLNLLQILSWMRHEI